MDKEKTFIYPKEVANASNQIKHDYKEWRMAAERLENHPLRYVNVVNGYGDIDIIDCTGIWKMNFLKMDKLRVADKASYDLVKKNSDIIQPFKYAKGILNRKWNQALTGKSGNKNVLDFRKGDILEAFGKYKNVREVHQLIKDWGFNISFPNLETFYYSNLTEIKDRKMRFAASSGDFYLATEAGRIEVLSSLFIRLREMFNDTDQVRYASEIRAIIEQIRKEVKGDEVRLTVDGKIDITATLQANRTLLELNQKLSVNAMIIGLVAAKKGVNPMDIQSQLANSFYNEYNGFNGIMDNEDDEIKLPSHLIAQYDWKEIDNIHNIKQVKNSKLMLEKELASVWKRNNIQYKGNIQESLKELEQQLNGTAIGEIVDVKPIEVEVLPEKKKEIQSKRDLLKQILADKRQNLTQQNKNNS